MANLNSEKMIDAVDSVTWYNGLAETLLEWKDLPVVRGMILCPLLTKDAKSGDWYQLQVIWMFLVELFGDYGTSPRYGWINDVDGFRQFIDLATKTYREAEDRDEEKEENTCLT